MAAKKPMTKKALSALKASIKKWEKLAAGKGKDRGGDNCALCIAFNDCRGCPVFMKTGKAQCRGTPYYDWRIKAERHGTWLNNWYTPDSDSARKEARRMLNFLKRLLPKEGRA